MSGPGSSSSSHPQLSRIESVLQRNLPASGSRGGDHGPSGRRQSFAGTSGAGGRQPISIVTGGAGVPSRTASTGSATPFVPRYVRGTIDRTDSHPLPGSQPSPISPARSPSRPRRLSNHMLYAGIVSSSPVRTTHSYPLHHPLGHAPPSRAVPSQSPSTSAAIANKSAFPLPAYIAVSAMRNNLLSAPTPGHVPNRQRLDSLRVQTPSSDEDEDNEDMDLPPQPPASLGGGLTAPPDALPALDATVSLPTRWNDADKYVNLTVSSDGRDLTFHGPTGTVDEAAAARANFPIPPACGVYYYEVEILNRGRQGHISIGFSAKSVRLTRLPGWEKLSWGYHGDDGRTFADQRSGSVYGPTFTTGDRIGCGIDFARGRAFFTKNGRYIADVFEDLNGFPGPGDLYPSVGLRSTEEAIRANFGQEPFAFNIFSHVQQRKNMAWAGIQQTRVQWTVDAARRVICTAAAPQKKADAKEKVREPIVAPVPIPPTVAAGAVLAAGTDAEETGGAGPGAPLNELILSYLTHHGYAGAAQAFRAQCEAKAAGVSGPTTSTSNGSDVMMIDAAPTLVRREETETTTRQRIYHAVLRGDMDDALALTRQHYPTALDRQNGLILFKLRCRKLGELIVQAAEALRRIPPALAVALPVQARGRSEARPTAPLPFPIDAKGKSKAASHMDEIDQGVLIEEEEEEEDAGAVDDSMDVDDDNSHHTSTNGRSARRSFGVSKSVPLTSPAGSRHHHTSSTTMHGESGTAAGVVDPMQAALAYGRSLRAECGPDPRPEIHDLFQRTSGLWAASAVESASYTSAAARAELANEVNQAILESQGRPARPQLEQLYRHTEIVVATLGALGVGAAAYADVRAEFIEA